MLNQLISPYIKYLTGLTCSAQPLINIVICYKTEDEKLFYCIILRSISVGFFGLLDRQEDSMRLRNGESLDLLLYFDFRHTSGAYLDIESCLFLVSCRSDDPESTSYGIT